MPHSSLEPIQPLNPDTYLNRLSPAESVEYEIVRDLIFTVGGVALWDTLAYLPTDIRIVRNSRLSFVIFCFVTSRGFALAHIWSAAIYSAAVDLVIPIRIAYIIQALLYMFSKMASSFLFLQRVLAVCHDDKWVQRGFSILWLSTFLSDITNVFGGSPVYIPGTLKFKHCGLRPWTSPSFYLFFIFDTGVVVVVTYKIWSARKEVREKRSIPWFHWVSNETFPVSVPQMILIGQVHYYMITVGLVAMASVMLSIPTIPQIYKTLFPPSLLFLTSSMACRVFRNIKLLSTDIFMEDTHLYGP